MTIPAALAEMRELMKKRGEMERAYERAMSIASSTAGKCDGMPRSSGGAPKVEKCGTYLADLQTDIDRINAKLELYREDVRRAIEAIPDSRDRAALRYRYIDLLPVRKVFRQMGYERESMYKIIKDAEKKWLT